MRLDLFSTGDSVLLLGEGNFSFSVCLHKHQLPIQIVATCFERKFQFKDQLENVKYLKSNNIPVFPNVDATKLHENVNLTNLKYSKIIFNFPHIGGKMKIHLNRELLKKFFESCSSVIATNGIVMVSLCQGQGGTPADKPQRRWDDSWQITEMAAYGNFVLTDVEPFLCENFTEYRCIGYRGQDIKFHLDGALVYIFARRKPPYTCMSESEIMKRLDLIPLKQNSKIFVPSVYAEMYQNNPLMNMDSCISLFRRWLVENFNEVSDNSKWINLSDDEIPVFVRNGNGVPCKVDSKQYVLRSCPLDIFPIVLENDSLPRNFILFPGMYFSPLSSDFLESAPIEFRFLIMGDNLLIKTKSFLNRLIDLFQDNSVKLLWRHLPETHYEGNNSVFVKSVTEIIYEKLETKKLFTAALLHDLKYKGNNVEVAVINAQFICQYFFQIGWRDIWADKTKVTINAKPIFKQSLLYPSTYKFDITLKCNEDHTEEQFCKVLWLAAGQFIEKVETVNKYTSPESWSSTCYRITYKSRDKPLYKNRVIEIHSKIVGRALELGLNVTIS